MLIKHKVLFSYIIAQPIVLAFFSGAQTVFAYENQKGRELSELSSIILTADEYDTSYDCNEDSVIDIMDLMRYKRNIVRSYDTLSPDTENDPVTKEPEELFEPSGPAQEYVKRLYKNIYNREPEIQEAIELSDKIESGSLTASAAMQDFLNNEEFISRNVSDHDYLMIMYRTLLGREPDEAGFGRWTNKIRFMSRQFVFRGFTLSEEFTGICSTNGFIKGTVEITEPRDMYYNMTEAVVIMYEKLCGRVPSADELNNITQRIQNKELTMQYAAFELIESDDFGSICPDDQEFAKALYSGLLFREPTETELVKKLEELKAGTERASMLRKIAASDEFYDTNYSKGLGNFLKMIPSNIKIDGKWHHFSKNGDIFLIEENEENKKLLALLDKVEGIIAEKGTSIQALYTYVTQTTAYKYMEKTKTPQQLEETGWTYFADYAMKNYYGVCYYLSAKMDILLEQAGYRCRLYHSTRSTGEHYWNQVFEDGVWMNYDLTNYYYRYTLQRMIDLKGYKFVEYVRPEYK